MPVQRQEPIEIPLGGQPSEHQARLFRGPGTLRSATNVDQTKAGGLRKRRGYRVPPYKETTHGEVIETRVVCLGVYQGELVVYGRANLYGVHADTGLIGSEAVTLRGPTMPGDWTRVDIVSAPISEEG